MVVAVKLCLPFGGNTDTDIPITSYKKSRL